MLPGEEMLIQRWEDWMLARELSDETIRQYKYAIYRLQGETRPAKALTEMVQEDIITFLASLGRRAAAKGTYFRAFRSFFGWAYAQGDIEKDITAGFRPKTPTEPPVDAFTQDEVAAILAAARAKSEKRYYAILLCYALGLRRSELCGIKAEDVDWNTQRVYVREAKGGRPRWVEANELAMVALRGLVIGSRSTGRSTPARPPYSETRAGDPPWTQGCAPTGDSYGSSAAMQQSRRNAEYSTLPIVGYAPNWFTMIVNQAATEAGLPRGRRNAHMLRASFASHLIQGGASVPVVSRLLGHANIATTHRYAAVWEGDRRRAVDKLTLGIPRPPTPTPVQTGLSVA